MLFGLLQARDENGVSMLMKCLNDFGDMADLRVNLLKSNVYLACVADYLRQDILNVTGSASGVLPFRYLGISLASLKLRTSDDSLLVDAISSKISVWP